MKRFCRITLLFLAVSMLVFNFSFADVDTNTQASENIDTVSTEIVDNESSSGNKVPFETETAVINTEKLEEGIEGAAHKGKSFIYTIIKTIGDISLPIAFLLVLWGAVLYFILGIRNLYKKRQGLLLMWGAITFVTIAKIMVLVGWFVFEYKA